jgi:hypothetical protein
MKAPKDKSDRTGDRFPLSDWMEARINSGNVIGEARADNATSPHQKGN